MTRRARADRMRAVALTAVLRRSGAVPDRADPHKWHAAQGVLSVASAKFMNWHLGRGGGGAIDLVMHLHGLSFGPALEWFEWQFTMIALPPPSAPTRPPLRLPSSVPERPSQVRRYLVEQRQLPTALLDPLIQAGSLYADARANAVFLLRDPHGQPVGAELRGTTGVAWRGIAPGSRKDLGCFAVPAKSLDTDILNRQCLGRRFADAELLVAEVAAWQRRRNDEHHGIHWGFARQDADRKLGRHYVT